jgi:hypothetical protein
MPAAIRRNSKKPAAVMGNHRPHQQIHQISLEWFLIERLLCC